MSSSQLLVEKTREDGRTASVSSPQRRWSIYIHDYAGHASQVQVAEALAARGHQVLLTYSGDLTTPHGDFAGALAEPNLTIRPVSIGTKINKANYLVRQWQDIRYARALVRDIRHQQYDVVLSCNTPLVPQAALLRHCRRVGIPFLHWWSEVYSAAVKDGLRHKSKALSLLIGGAYESLEKYILNRSDAAIALCHGILAIAEGWNLRTCATVVPIAAPVASIVPADKDNPWSRRHGLHETRNLLYSGTLGIKHRPDYLARLAASLQSEPDVRIVVVSNGVGADWLAEEQRRKSLDNLYLLPYQDYADYAHVLAAADLHITILQDEASRYSVPSKVYSQLCSGRAQVAVVSLDNDAARLILDAGAGLVSPPADYSTFEHHVRELLDDQPRRQQYGEAGRRYVEEQLDVQKLVLRYETIIGRMLDYA